MVDATSEGNVSEIESSDHLPECLNDDDTYGLRGLCICDELRACEQRMLLSKPNIELSAVYGYEAGRSDGWTEALDAAREAVERVSTLFEPLGAALTAIDALRRESDV